MKKQTTAFLIATAAFALAVSLRMQWTSLFNDFTFHGDIRQEIYWIYRLVDPSLFPNDALADYSSWTAPYCLMWLYRIGLHLFDALTIAKGICLVVCPLFAALFFLFLRRLNIDPAPAFLAASICVLALWSKGTAPFGVGDSEDFAVLFLAGFLYLRSRENHIGCAAWIVLTASFYAPAALVCLFALALEYLSLEKWKGLALLQMRSTYAHAFAALASLFVVMSKKIFNSAADPGPFSSRSEMLLMPEFAKDGRAPFFYDTLWEKLANIRSGFSLDTGTIILAIAAIVLLLIYRWKILKRIPPVGGRFLASMLILFFLAHIILLDMFSPSRYVRLPLPIFLSMLVGLGIDTFYQRSYSAAIKTLLTFVTLVFALVIWGPLLQNGYRTVPENMSFPIIANLPKDSMIAAFPYVADNVPTLSKRSVYISDEMSLPYVKNFNDMIAKRFDLFFDAYFSADFDEISAFCKTEKVTHFLVIKEHFTRPWLSQEQIYFRPYHDRIKHLAHKNIEKGFAALSPPEQSILFDDGKTLLFKCGSK